MEKRKTVSAGDDAGIAAFVAWLIHEKLSSLPEKELLHIALSGGKTPMTVFDQLRLRYSKQINWKRIGFFQVDERCVPPDDPESNFRMIRQNLLHGLGFPEQQLFRMKGENDPEDEANRYEQILRENLPSEGNWPVLDMVLLGLGSDGHTASLFPGDQARLHSGRSCEVATHPVTQQKRITLTLPVINRARCQVFVVTGSEKAPLVKEILKGIRDEHLPASLVLPVKGEQIWLLDDPAAALL